MADKKSLADGDVVQYVDEHGVEHSALVTTCWGVREYEPEVSGPAINVAYVSKDPNARDQWGQQMKHDSSVVHRSSQSAPGRFWYQK